MNKETKFLVYGGILIIFGVVAVSLANILVTLALAFSLLISVGVGAYFLYTKTSSPANLDLNDCLKVQEMLNHPKLIRVNQLHQDYFRLICEGDNHKSKFNEYIELAFRDGEVRDILDKLDMSVGILKAKYGYRDFKTLFGTKISEIPSEIFGERRHLLTYVLEGYDRKLLARRGL